MVGSEGPPHTHGKGTGWALAGTESSGITLFPGAMVREVAVFEGMRTSPPPPQAQDVSGSLWVFPLAARSWVGVPVPPGTVTPHFAPLHLNRAI